MDSTYETNLSFFLPDGRYEPMLNPEVDMAHQICEHMGTDAERSFRVLLESIRNEQEFPYAFYEDYWDVRSYIENIRIILSCDSPDLKSVNEVLDKIVACVERTMTRNYEN